MNIYMTIRPKVEDPAQKYLIHFIQNWIHLSSCVLFGKSVTGVVVVFLPVVAKCLSFAPYLPLSPFSVTLNCLIPSLLLVYSVLCSLFLFLLWSNSPFPNLLLLLLLPLLPLLLPAPLLFTLATHLSPSIRPSSGHPAITLHYRHIQHTNFTHHSTWTPSLPLSYWSKQKSA